MDPGETVATPRTSQLSRADCDALTERYEILEEVGRGGMGVVYKARHVLLDRPVAVKVCLPGAQAERLVREGQLAARVRSPNVVGVHDFDRLPDGRLLLVMEWVEGSTLGAILKASQGPLPEPRVVAWMRQVCQGMQSAADHGVIHRDLKPANILVDSSDVAKVADFGVARSHTSMAVDLTHAEGMMGTPLYMAPEQAENPRGVDTRSDIYSFGATFYHILTGEPPFQGETSFTVMFKHKTEPLVAPQSRNPLLNPRLGECLERCLAKCPNDRFQAFNDVAAHIEPHFPALDPWSAADDPQVKRHLDRYRSRRDLYLGAGAGLSGPDTYVFPNGRTVRIGFGDLVREKADALVSSDDENLSMLGGVSAALRAAAGPDYFEQAQRLTPIRHGRAVVTPAGALSARFVFHAVTTAPRLHARPSRDIVNELMESCFYHADTLGLKSIAFPLLGTGKGMLPPEVCLDTMFRFLARKFARGVTSVCDVRIVIYRGPGATTTEGV
jgi:eukaryotic-like serine/threonine-protein kinase